MLTALLTPADIERSLLEDSCAEVNISEKSVAGKAGNALENEDVR